MIQISCEYSEDVYDIITGNTQEAFLKLWMENIRNNLFDNQNSSGIKELEKHDGIPAVVIAAGPSVWDKKHLEILKSSRFHGKIIAVDRMLIPLLKKGIVPDYVVNADAHRENIYSFFDDPIVDRYSENIKAIFATLAPSDAVKRFKGEKYFYNAMIDNPKSAISVTKCLKYLNGFSNLNTTGNVGGFGIIFAYYLRCNPIATIGLNLGYPLDTPLKETYCYNNIKSSEDDLTDKEIFDKYFVKVYNPYFEEECFTEPIFSYYKMGLLEAVEKMTSEGFTIYNCTESGIFFDEKNVICTKFRDFIEKHGGI